VCGTPGWLTAFLVCVWAQTSGLLERRCGPARRSARSAELRVEGTLFGPEERLLATEVAEQQMT